MDIRNCIAELLLLHDCVIIPGFGGFIGNYSPARIDRVHHTFEPPAKRLLFNINLKQNDGLLANAVAESFGTSYAEACRMIEEFAEDCRFCLKTGKPFILPEIGQLNSGKEGIINFEQDHSANLLPDAFGLTPFISPPVVRHPSVLNHDWNISGRAGKRSGEKFILPRTVKWAAAIVLPIGIAAVIGLTQYDKLSANFANNAGIMSSFFTKYSETSRIGKTEAPVTVPVKVLQPVTMTPVVTPARVSPAGIHHDDRYAVIIGAFRVQENAEKLVDELQKKGIVASIFDQSKTGLYRVTIGTSSDRDNIKQFLASVKSKDFDGAWILEK
jgi:hypothetical protein